MTLCRQCDEEHDSLYDPSPRPTAPVPPAFLHIPACGPEMPACASWLEWDDMPRPTGLALRTAAGWMIDYTPMEG